jgi:hypothetical protein
VFLFKLGFQKYFISDFLSWFDFFLNQIVFEINSNQKIEKRKGETKKYIERAAGNRSGPSQKLPTAQEAISKQVPFFSLSRPLIEGPTCQATSVSSTSVRNLHPKKA